MAGINIDNMIWKSNEKNKTDYTNSIAFAKAVVNIALGTPEGKEKLNYTKSLTCITYNIALKI